MQNVRITNRPHPEAIQVSDNDVMNDPQPISPRRRLQSLLSIPDSQRTEAQWEEIVELEIQLAPGNRQDAPSRLQPPGPNPRSNQPRRDAPTGPSGKTNKSPFRGRGKPPKKPPQPPQ